MKKIFLLGLVTLLFVSCQESGDAEKEVQRYFAESAEIETLKAGIAAYEAANWEKWRSHFADTAKIYVNSNESVTVDERLAGMKEMTLAMSSYGFDKEDDHIEMVVDKNDERWVYYWGLHKGTFAANNKELHIPVHLAVQFVDGKIAKEHVYFDATSMNAEFAALAAAAAATADEPE